MQLFLTTLYSLAASFAFLVIFEVRDKKALIAGSIGGALGWLAYDLTQLIEGVYYLVPYFIAALVLTAYSETMARLLKKPATVFLIGALFPLVPGTGIYQSMVYFVSGKQDAFFQSLRETLAVTGTLVAGMFFVSTIIRTISVKRRLKNRHYKHS